MERNFSNNIPEQLKILAQSLPFRLYVVGGAVRDFLISGKSTDKTDWDVCAPAPPDLVAEKAKSLNFTVQSVYKNTGTMKLTDSDGIGYEFSSFRSDKYVRGEHTPYEVAFTDDMVLDAKRRDFTCNAIYYDIKEEKFADPLRGIEAIAEKRISTVKESEKVFSEDGLRLMRLARLSAQQGFTPDESCIRAARENCALIDDIHPQRIYAELKGILLADGKFSLPYAQYRGLKILLKTGVFGRIFPELAKGEGMEQRKDYHDHDVLEHSLRCVMYSPMREESRLAALLHDVGKIPCMIKNGNCHNHEKVGVPIAEQILKRLNVPGKIQKEVLFLVSEHMYDRDARTREGRLRRYIVSNYEYIQSLMEIKQADYSACKDDLSPSETVSRWKQTIEQMKAEGAPFSVKDLEINGKDVIECGVEPRFTSAVLNELLLSCAVQPKLNEREKLKKIAIAKYKELKKRENNHD